MSGAGNGVGDNGPGENSPARRVRLGPLNPSHQVSPDQGCIGCLIGIGILLLSVAIWATVYFIYQPAFHNGLAEPGQDPPQQLRPHSRNAPRPKPAANRTDI